jgi:hypothetical protein
MLESLERSGVVKEGIRRCSVDELACAPKKQVQDEQRLGVLKATNAQVSCADHEGVASLVEKNAILYKAKRHHDSEGYLCDAVAQTQWRSDFATARTNGEVQNSTTLVIFV